MDSSILIVSLQSYIILDKLLFNIWIQIPFILIMLFVEASWCYMQPDREPEWDCTQLTWVKCNPSLLIKGSEETLAS